MGVRDAPERQLSGQSQGAGVARRQQRALGRRPGPALPLVRARAGELVESDKLREAESKAASARSRRSRRRGHGESPGPPSWAQGLLF